MWVYKTFGVKHVNWHIQYLAGNNHDQKLQVFKACCCNAVKKQVLDGQCLKLYRFIVTLGMSLGNVDSYLQDLH